MDTANFKWTREPESFQIKGDVIQIVTRPHTDLWQRTYYHFQNDNAPVFQMETEEPYFSFVVKTDFSTATTGLTNAGSSCTWTAKTG